METDGSLGRGEGLIPLLKRLIPIVTFVFFAAAGNYFLLAPYFGNRLQFGNFRVTLLDLVLVVLAESAVACLLVHFIVRRKSAARVRRVQFRLTTLFVVTLAVSCGLLYFRIHRAARQAVAAASAQEKAASTLTVSDGHLVLRPNHQFTPHELTYLRTLTSLTSVDLTGTNVGDESLEAVGALESLESLNLSGCGISDDGLPHLRNLRRLKTLILSDTSVTDSGLQNLTPLSSLETLALANTRVTGPGLAELEGLSELRSIFLAGPDVDDSTADYVKRIPSLTSVSLVDSRVTDNGLPSLQGLDGLQELSLARSRVSDAGMLHLRELPNLRYLELTGNRDVTDTALEHLSHIRTLDGLLLAETSVSNKGMRHLSGLRLSRLDLRQTGVTAEIVDSLQTEFPLCLVIHSSVLGTGTHAPLVGRLVSDFSLPTLDGGSFTLSDYRGKVVLVHFWAAWCKSCVQGTPDEKLLYQKLMERHSNFVPISLSVDDRDAEPREYVARHNLAWKHAWIGPYSDVATKFDLRGGGAGYFFLIGPDGKVVAIPTSLQQVREKVSMVLSGVTD